MEFHAAAATVDPVVYLVLEAVTGAVGLIDSEPLFVASTPASVSRQLGPGLTAAGGAPQVVAVKRLAWPRRLQTEIEKVTDLIRLYYRIATKHVVLQDTGKRPCEAGIGSITPAALSEVGGNIVELPPADRHLVAICGVNRNRALVRSVTEDVLAILIDVGLITGEYAKLRDHLGRSRHLSRSRRRVIGFLDVLSKRHRAHWRELG